VDYDPAAECPTWLAHLDLVFGGDAAYIRGFQELCGYSLLQYNPEQIMAILYGTGKNGKSVTIGALCASMGRLRRQYRRRESHGAPGRRAAV